MNTPFISPMHLSLPLLLLLAKATIILLVALGATLAMQRASAGARHLVWLVTLGTLLLVPAITAWGPVKVAVLPAAERPAREEGRERREEVAARELIAPQTNIVPAPVTPTSAGESSSSLPSPLSSLSLFQLLLAAWAAVTLGILASLAWSGLAVRRLVRHASPLEHPSWRAPLYEVADRMGLADAPRLVRSDDVKMPFACGIITPTIVLPADCDGWSLERRRAVLLHELAHVRRHDLLGHTLGRVACAFYWFHPLVWSAARQLRNESERACDDLAVSCGTRATDYAEHLLEIVTSVRKDATPSVALAMARRKEFEGRMLAILDPELLHSSPSRRQSAALIGSLALLAMTVAAVSPVARPANATPAPVAARGAASRVPANVLAMPEAPRRAVDARGDTSRTEAVREHVAEAKTEVGVVTNVVVQAPHDAMMLLEEPSRGQSKDERAQLLARVLGSDTSAALRRVAAWGLNEYADEQVAAEALATALRRDASASVREMAAWSLSEANRNATATEALSAALQGDADANVRLTAAWALGEAGDRGAIPALVAVLKPQSSAALRMRALWAIGNIEPKEAPPAVMAALRDPDAHVRHVAAWALFSIEDPAAVGALQEALKAEQDKDVQLAEIRAIGALGERSVEALKSLVDSPDPRMRSMAVRALAGGNAAGPWPWPWPQPRPYP